MARYAIWDKKSPIYTLAPDKNGKSKWTAEEYIAAHCAWAENPAVKIVVGGGFINGTVFMEFEATKDHYQRLGIEWPENATDRAILDAIEEWEDNPPPAEPSPEERMAAALEFQNIMML